MSEQGVVADFVEKTQKEIDRLTRKVASGNCADISEYRALCGEIYAYRHSIDMMRAVVQLYYEFEDEKSEVSNDE